MSPEKVVGLAFFVLLAGFVLWMVSYLVIGTRRHKKRMRELEEWKEKTDAETARLAAVYKADPTPENHERLMAHGRGIVEELFRPIKF